MKKQMAILLAGMLAAALLLNGCAAGEGTPQKAERDGEHAGGNEF